MRAVLVIAWKDLRQRLRDRSAIITAFVAPLGIAFIVSSAFGSGFTGGDFSATYAVVDQDNTTVSQAFTERVLRSPQLREHVEIENVKTLDAARALIADDEVEAAFVIPVGFESNVTASRKATMTVLRNPEAEIGSDIAEAIASVYTEQINAARLSVATAIGALGGTPDPTRIATLAQQAATEQIPIQLVDGEISLREVSGINYFGPAMAVFSLFFTTSFVARSIIAERQEGTLPRVLAAPISRQSIVLGKTSSAFILGIVSFVVMFGFFSLVKNVNWGDPLALVVLTVATVLAIMGLMTLVQTGAKTIEGADAISQVSTLTLALFGGSFFPIFQMPKVMQYVSYATPNGWALRGYTDLAYDGATLTDIWPNLLAIGAFAVITGGLGMWRARRLV